MEKKLRITSSVAIPISEIRFRFSRSGGAGGQNVNKVSTKVELLFDIANSTALSPSQKERIAARLKSMIGFDGWLKISSQESRSQWRNRVDALEKFGALLSGALRPSAPRLASKATKASRERRLRRKSLHSRKKEQRRRVVE